MFSVSLGPLSVQVSHLVALAALLVAVGVGKLNRRRQPSGIGHRASGIGDMLSTMVWVGLLTARVAFVATWWNLYQADLWSIANIRDGGFSPWAGLAAVGWLAHLARLARPASPSI